MDGISLIVEGWLFYTMASIDQLLLSSWYVLACVSLRSAAIFCGATCAVTGIPGATTHSTSEAGVVCIVHMFLRRKFTAKTGEGICGGIPPVSQKPSFVAKVKSLM